MKFEARQIAPDQNWPQENFLLCIAECLRIYFHLLAVQLVGHLAAQLAGHWAHQAAVGLAFQYFVACKAFCFVRLELWTVQIWTVQIWTVQLWTVQLWAVRLWTVQL